MARFVDIETPYSGYLGNNEEEIKRNLLYARMCTRGSLLHIEIPSFSRT
ncbi:hypothetical protein HRbin34_00177 [bacterium HR34]|nr:hypothetical protein HRbin34_00177 [bacterium HR34]